MRKIIAALQTSLDGFIEGPNGELDWLVAEDPESWNEEFDMLIDRIEKSSDKAQILKDTQRAHEIIVDEAPWAFIVHDRNQVLVRCHLAI